MEEELEGLVTHLRNAKGSVLVEWLQQVRLILRREYIFKS